MASTAAGNAPPFPLPVGPVTVREPARGERGWVVGSPFVVVEVRTADGSLRLAVPEGDAPLVRVAFARASAP